MRSSAIGFATSCMDPFARCWLASKMDRVIRIRIRFVSARFRGFTICGGNPATLRADRTN
jgi:hypothetical protein